MDPRLIQIKAAEQYLSDRKERIFIRCVNYNYKETINYLREKLCNSKSK